MSSRGAKFTEPPTVTQHPGVYKYVLETSVYPQLKKEQLEMQSTIGNLPVARMAGAPDEAVFLSWLVELMGAKRVCEVGTFRGSTALEIALALPSDGKLTAVDITDKFLVDDENGYDATKFWESAGVKDKIDVVVANAADFLTKPASEGGYDSEKNGLFDLSFVDAHKQDYDSYYEGLLRHTRVGGVIAIDNTLWHGRVLVSDEQVEKEDDADTRAIKAINTKVSNDPRVKICHLVIADGLILCRKL